MPVTVVKRIEVVDVNKELGSWITADRPIKHPTVEQAGQRVGLGLLLQSHRRRDVAHMHRDRAVRTNPRLQGKPATIGMTNFIVMIDKQPGGLGRSRPLRFREQRHVAKSTTQRRISVKCTLGRRMADDRGNAVTQGVLLAARYDFIVYNFK